MSDTYQRVRRESFVGVDGPVTLSGMWTAHPDGDHKVIPADALVCPIGSETHAAMTDLTRATASEAEHAARIRNAVTIAQMGGVSDEALTALLHFAAAGMSPTARRALRDAGIDPDPTGTIVIDRADLPEAIIDGPESQLVHAGHVERHRTTDPAEVRASALMHLAVAEHLEQHPFVPVTDEQIDLVEHSLVELANYSTRYKAVEIARRLAEHQAATQAAKGAPA